MGIQQCTDQERGQVESSLPDPRRAIRTNRHVLRINKLPSHISDDDEYHLSQRSGTRMAISMHTGSSSSQMDGSRGIPAATTHKTPLSLPKFMPPLMKAMTTASPYLPPTGSWRCSRGTAPSSQDWQTKSSVTGTGRDHSIPRARTP